MNDERTKPKEFSRWKMIVKRIRGDEQTLLDCFDRLVGSHKIYLVDSLNPSQKTLLIFPESAKTHFYGLKKHKREHILNLFRKNYLHGIELMIMFIYADRYNKKFERFDIVDKILKVRLGEYRNAYKYNRYELEWVE